METMLLVVLTSRWLHIVSAAVMLGGAVFMRYALLPALAECSEPERHHVREAVRKRWSIPVHLAITLLILTGFYNFYARFADVRPMPYHALFGIKFLLAMIVFFFASALVGRSRGLQPIRDRAEFYLNLNIILVVIIIALGGWMRFAPLKTEAPQEPSAVVRPVATSNSDSIGTSIATVAKE